MTTNEMIYRTLRTRMDKAPKYRDVLADLGIEVYDSDSSTQGFWSVRYIPTGKMLVISKRYDNRTHLYGGDNGWQKTNAKDLKKFDYMGFLKRNRGSKGLPYFYDKSYVKTEYKELGSTLFESKRDIRWAERDLEEVDKKIADLIEKRKWYEKRLADATDRLRVARERVNELRQKM